ncbi:MAG TPA: DUF488 domain-containing protein [Tepidisphaeraceae bacterium]|nr:DUF488 domain-containing protein [Tepidisphaeraceae bacterium]
MDAAPPVIFTVGHSTRSAEDFAKLLHAHGIGAIADVRLIPKSRRYPHFGEDQLARWLPEVEIAYIPFKQLGGRRRPAKDSLNAGWRNDSFRGYADFMQTEAFGHAVEELIALAAQRPTAMMCAEAVPWRCHRSLISDALLVRGWRVLDIIGSTKATEHRLTRFAKVDGLRVTYPPEQPQLFATRDECER